MNACNIYGCNRDKVYALIRSDGKISRFGFSKSVLEHCGNQFLSDGWMIKYMPFYIGKKLNAMEISNSGVYVIVAKKGSKGRPLRVCYSNEMAGFLCDDDSREIYEFWI
jgi:hypothetical protein